MQLRPSTAVDVLNSPNPSFALIRKELDAEDGIIVGRAILTLLINELLNYFNVGKTMSDKQVAATANLILEDYATLKPDDFKLCFKRAMRGQYGKVYDRIDGELIFEWIEQYLYEKAQEIEAFRKNENAQLKKESNFKIGQDFAPTIDVEYEDENTPVPMPAWFKEDLQKRQAHKKREIKLTPAREMTPEQKLYNDLIKRFDESYRERGFEVRGQKFVKFYGKTMNVEDYLNYKSLQIERIVARESAKEQQL